MTISSNSQRMAFLLLGVTLALGFIIASEKMSKAVAQLRSAQPEVSVKGVATQNVRADEAELSAELSWRGVDAVSGRIDFETQRQAYRNLIEKAGFTESEIDFQSITVRRLDPARDNANGVDYRNSARGKVPEYVIACSIVINSTKVDAIAKLFRQEVNFKNDVELRLNSPVFRILHLDDSKKELLEVAARDARRRAEALVAGSGSRIGTLISASQGVFQISARGRINESDYNSVDSTSIDKSLRLVVTMRYELIKE